MSGANFQSTLRVTAYAFAKKGLSIGMVNRKGFAEIRENIMRSCASYRL